MCTEEEWKKSVHLSIGEGNKLITNGSYIDTHCHLDLYPNPLIIVKEVSRLGIHVVAVTNAPFVFNATVSFAKNCDFIHPAIGLHPELVKSHGKQLPALLEALEHTLFVGEVGLDYSTKDDVERSEQRKVFESILSKCHDYGDKFISVHSRRATNDVINMIGSKFHGTAVLHWFSGTVKQLETAQNNGLYFSVNPAMILSDSGQRLIAAMNPSRVLTETDGPFIDLKGSSARPQNVSYVVGYLAKLWGMSESEVRDKIYSNFKLVMGRGMSTRREELLCGRDDYYPRRS